MYADFAKVKEKVSLEQAIALLGLKMELVYGGSQYRCACPVCEKPEGRSLVVTPGKGFYCFRSHKGGSVIDLVAHVKRMGLKESASWLLGEEVTISPVAQEPQEVKKTGFDAGKYRASLATEHELLTQAGLTKEFCEARGIGVPAKGTHKGLIAIPTTDKDGHIVYVGVKEVHLPKVQK